MQSAKIAWIDNDITEYKSHFESISQVIKRKSVIYSEGATAGALYQVITGIVKIVRTSKEGHEQITDFILPGENFGYEALHYRQYHLSAVATTAVNVKRFVPLRSLAKEHEVSVHRALLNDYMKSQRHLAMMNHTTAHVRVSAFIVDIVSRLDETQFDNEGFSFPRQDIASFLGLTIETVCRVLQKLKKDKIISISKAKIRVIDLQSLKKSALF